MSRKPYKRRNFFVKKDFQGRFILIFLVIAVAGGLLSLVSFNLLAIKKIELLMFSIHIPVRKLNEILSQEMLYSNGFSLLFVLLGALVAVRWLSGRVSGPLYRIKKDLERVRASDLSFHITLRRKDEFKDLASDLNLLVESLRRFFTEMKDHAEVLDEYVRQMERNSHRPDLVKTKLNQLVFKTEDMKKALSRFRT